MHDFEKVVIISLPSLIPPTMYSQTHTHSRHVAWAEHCNFTFWHNSQPSDESFVPFCELCWYSCSARADKQLNVAPAAECDKTQVVTLSRVKIYRETGASCTNRNHRRNRIIHGFLLMSPSRSSSAAPPSLLEQQRTKSKTHCASNFHRATRHISAVPQLRGRQWRPPNANSEGQQEVKNSRTVSRPIGHGGAGLSAWTLTCGSRALSRSDTCVLFGCSWVKLTG